MADFKQQVSIKATSTRVDNIRHSETIEVAAAAVLKPEWLIKQNRNTNNMKAIVSRSFLYKNL